MPTVLAPICVRVDGEPTPAETTIRIAGPYVVVLTTALPEAPLTVVSTFIGADDLDTTVVDVVLGPRPRARTDTRRVPRDEIPVTHARGRCVVEHLAVVRAVLGDGLRSTVTIDVTDAALERAGRA